MIIPYSILNDDEGCFGLGYNGGQMLGCRLWVGGLVAADNIIKRLVRFRGTFDNYIVNDQ